MALCLFCYHSHMDTPAPGNEISEHNITTSDPAAIEALIASDSSPVGIDATQTHSSIISNLVKLDQRLDKPAQPPTQTRP